MNQIAALLTGRMFDCLLRSAHHRQTQSEQERSPSGRSSGRSDRTRANRSDEPSFDGTPLTLAQRRLNLADLPWVREGQLPGQRGLQVRLKELHLPTASLEEVHVDLVRGAIVAGH